MAAITKPSAIRPAASTTGAPLLVTYGATIAVGDPLYLDAADSKYKLADSNNTSAIATVRGIALTPGVDAGYGYLMRTGSVICVGSTLVVGTTYVVGSTAGTIVPITDLTTGDYVSIVGTASTSTQLDLDINATNIVKP